MLIFQKLYEISTLFSQVHIVMLGSTVSVYIIVSFFYLVNLYALGNDHDFLLKIIHTYTYMSGGGHGNPLQYSCLENPMVRGA